ncbi:hypothetical protein AOLI_G00133460 [Acnodon oligacanthus]
MAPNHHIRGGKAVQGRQDKSSRVTPRRHESWQESNSAREWKIKEKARPEEDKGDDSDRTPQLPMLLYPTNPASTCANHPVSPLFICPGVIADGCPKILTSAGQAEVRLLLAWSQPL